MSKEIRITIELPNGIKVVDITLEQAEQIGKLLKLLAEIPQTRIVIHENWPQPYWPQYPHWQPVWTSGNTITISNIENPDISGTRTKNPNVSGTLSVDETIRNSPYKGTYIVK